MSWLQAQASKHFDEYPDEVSFMKYLGQVFQVSYAGREQHGRSSYSFYILKPNRKPAKRYGLNAELVALYAPYIEVQARELSSLEELQRRFKNRVHPVWTILISDDENTAQDYDSIIESIGLEVYCIPFSKAELLNKPDPDFIFNRLEEYIHKRDLFAVQSPLKSDLFFFGREQTVHDIIGKIEEGQNFGLFGLRKVGKTSVLFAVERYLETVRGYSVVHLDCQQPAIYLRRWNGLLAHICNILTNQNFEGIGQAKQAQIFEDIVANYDRNILLIFDEIENIGFDDTSPVEHWNEDFLPFWATIRAVHQSTKGKLVFGVAGVNPHIFEVPLVQGKDNPFSLGVEPIYLRFLDSSATRIMIRSIGDYMSLTFEADAFSWIFTQFGGHPLLTRKACSAIYHKVVEGSGPALQADDFVDNAEWLNKYLEKDVQAILIVLAQHYPEEYDHLVALAKGESDWIELLLSENPNAIDHIVNYSIVEHKDNGWVFTIATVQRFLEQFGITLKNTVHILTESTTPTEYDILPEMDQLKLWNRLGSARNTLEPKLRTLIHRVLIVSDGPKQGLQIALGYLPPKRQSNLVGYNIKAIFGGTSKALYLSDLKNIVMGEWDKFKHVFGNDRKKFEFRLDMINNYRADAHANNIDEATVLEVEAIVRSLLEEVSDFLD